MKIASYGRIVFGASAVLFGVAVLTWPDIPDWQHLRILWGLPFGEIISRCLAGAQIAGGIGMLFARTGRVASIVLGIDYALFSLACIHGIIAHPDIYQEYGSFFEEFSLLSGAIAVYAATEANAARSAALGRVARIGFGLSALSFALEQKVYLHETAALVPAWIPPNQLFWAILTTVAFALAALAVLVNRQARLALRLLALMLAVFAVLVWIPILIAHPWVHSNWTELALTLLTTGAAWIVADLKSF